MPGIVAYLWNNAELEGKEDGEEKVLVRYDVAVELFHTHTER